MLEGKLQQSERLPIELFQSAAWRVNVGLEPLQTLDFMTN